MIEDADSKLELKGDLTIGDAGSVAVLGGGTFATKVLENDDEQVIAEGKTKVGMQFGASGSIAVAGADSAFTSAGSLTLGDKGNGTLEIRDGGAFTAKGGAKFGVELGSSGDASVVDAGSTLTVQGTLTLGDAGAGRLLVGDGATGTTSADAVTIGKQLNAIGELVVSGPMSVFEVDGALVAGAAGHAEVLVEAGGWLDSASLTLGAEAFVQDRIVTVEGAGSLLSTGETVVGDQGNGSMVIRDGGRVETGIDPATSAGARLGHGAFGDGSVLISGDGSAWEVGGELTVGDGGFGIIDVELGGRLTTAGGRLGASGNGGPGHVTVINPDSRWTSSAAIVLAGTGFGDADPGTGTGQALLDVLDNGTVEAAHVTLGAGLAPGYLNVQSGGELVAEDGIALRWGNLDVDGPSTAVRSPDGALAVGNASASFTNGALGSFDQVLVQAPLGGGHVSALHITDATIAATSTLDPAVIVGGEAGGTVSLSNGLLDAAGGEVHIVDHGSLVGTGTVRGNVIVSGSGFVAPGLSPGTLTIEGDYTQGPEGVLQIELAGLAAGTFDILHVTGDVALGGTLALSFIDGFAPQADDQFTFLMVTGALAGAFDQVLVHNLAPGFDYDLGWNGGALQMQALNTGVYVPLPAPWLLLVGGCALLARVRRSASSRPTTPGRTNSTS